MERLRYGEAYVSEQPEQVGDPIPEPPKAAPLAEAQPVAAPNAMMMQRVDADGRPIGEPKQVNIPSPNLGRIPVNRKFTKEVAQAIRARKAAGEKICKLAREFDCCRHTIQRLCRGACYREV